MKKSEFEELIREIVERTIEEKLEERMEAMFYKTLVESNMISNVISTVYENIDRTERAVIKEERITTPPTPTQQKKRTSTALPEGLGSMGMFFEGTTPDIPSQDGNNASDTLRTEALQEGVNPNFIGEEGVKLDILGLRS